MRNDLLAGKTYAHLGQIGSGTDQLDLSRNISASSGLYRDVGRYLVSQSPEDDLEAEAAYRDFAAPLKRLVFLMTGSNQAAEDAVHEVFSRCVLRLGGIDHPESYLRAAVINECRAQHRRRGRRKKGSSLDRVGGSTS